MPRKTRKKCFSPAHASIYGLDVSLNAFRSLCLFLVVSCLFSPTFDDSYLIITCAAAADTANTKHDFCVLRLFCCGSFGVNLLPHVRNERKEKKKSRSNERIILTNTSTSDETIVGKINNVVEVNGDDMDDNINSKNIEFHCETSP